MIFFLVLVIFFFGPYIFFKIFKLGLIKKNFGASNFGVPRHRPNLPSGWACPMCTYSIPPA
jgi:hypothetical protein